MTWTMDKLAEQENTIAQLRADLATLVPLVREHPLIGALGIRHPALDAARRVLADYDQEG